jgi:D-cysteine desulfhydrase
MEVEEPPPPPPAPAYVIPLFKQFPGLAEKLPHVSLGAFPTPIDHARALGARLGLGGLYVKRDDISGEKYGGNKVRKLEFDLGEAQRERRNTIITFGGVGSNQAVATAIYASELGMKTIVMLLPQHPADHVRHTLLAAHRYGAELRYYQSQKQVEVGVAKLIRSMPDDPPYLIGAGDSTVLANAGFVNAAFELKDQIDAGVMPEPDFLYVAMGSMGSAVGLTLGLKAAGLKTQVVAVRASSLDAPSESKMIKMFRETNDFLISLDPSFPKLTLLRKEALVLKGYLGEGYGRPTPKGMNAAKLFAEHIGVELDLTYTGKAFAAVIDDAKKKMKGKVVLFWDTYNSRKIDLEGARYQDLPNSLHGYFKPKVAFAKKP